MSNACTQKLVGVASLVSEITIIVTLLNYAMGDGKKRQTNKTCVTNLNKI